MKLQKTHEEKGTKFYSLYTVYGTYNFFKNSDGFHISVQGQSSAIGNVVRETQDTVISLQAVNLEEAKKEILHLMFEGRIL